MQITDVREGVPWGYRTPFERWVEDDLNMPLTRGYFAEDLFRVETFPWSLKGIQASFIDIIGAESLAGLYVGEIAPAQSTVRTRQLFDEVIYVLAGRGNATVTTTDGTATFEWGPGSLFAIPLNCSHQLHNASATQAVRYVSVNTLPMVYNLYRDADFVFGGSDWDFRRFSASEAAASAVLYRPDRQHSRTAVDLYETLFVPNVMAVQRSSFAERGEGSRTSYFELANSPISVHIASFEGGVFVNPHRHGPSAFVFTLEGTGYSLMWPEGANPVRFDWPKDDAGVVVPPNWWWHGHFITSPAAVQLAIKLRSRKHPMNHLFDKTHKLVSEGGTVLRYQDLDRPLREGIWKTFQAECERAGVRVREPDLA